MPESQMPAENLQQHEDDVKDDVRADVLGQDVIGDEVLGADGADADGNPREDTDGFRQAPLDSDAPADKEAPSSTQDEHEPKAAMMSLEGYTFSSLVGFDAEIARVRDLGILEGAQDSSFARFVEQMRMQHGLFDEPIGGAILFQAPVRDDADRLMLATANELNRPTLRMKLVEAPMGAQALCVMATPGVTEGGFNGPGTLVLEGLDQWGFPEEADFGLSLAELALSGSMQGAMKALSIIRSAASDPSIAVLASASGPLDEKSPFVDLLGPMTLFEVPLPSEQERTAIWEHLMCKHISMSALDIVELVKLSSGLPRCDIFAAAREAVAQAFHKSIESLSYVPVSRGNLLDKVAAYQPLDSEEYRAIEDSVAEDFLDEIERYDRGEF